MVEKELLRDCVRYFKDNPGFARVFSQIKEKYRSLGKIGGQICIPNLSQQEKDSLSGLLREDYSRQNQATIRLSDFQKALQKTRFAGLSLEDILKAYYAEEDLLSKKEEQQLFLQERERFFQKIILDLAGTTAGSWLKEVVVSSSNAYSIFLKRYNLNKDKLEMDIYYTARALNNLPAFTGQKMRLALFASTITKNPHAFDRGSELDDLLQYGLVYLFGSQKPRNAEERAELYYQAGILVNEVANYTLAYGLQAYAHGSLHPGWEGFYGFQEPMLLTLMNLSRLQRVCSPAGRVFVLENTGVFASILDRISDQPVSLICTGGQLKLASLLLLDLLVKENTTIYYSGDFDPEGLQIADKLKRRYGDNLILWHYSTQDYEQARSQELIAEGRLGKLSSIQDEELKKIGSLLRKTKIAGYQELLLNILLADIKELI